jgi:hypothetical protein
MSQPHAPRPDDQPAQQPSDPREPRTQAIPIIQPDAQPAVQPGPAAAPAPGPAFLTEAGWPATAAPQAAPSPAPLTAPPPPVPPAQMPPPSFPQPVEQVWPQPGVPGDGADRNAALAAQPTDRVDFVPGFGTPEHPPAAPAGSTAVTGTPSTNELPVAAPGTAPGAAAQSAGAGKGAAGKGAAGKGGAGKGTAAKRLSTRLTGVRPRTAARHGTTALGLGAGVVGLALLELGLARNFGARSLWSLLPTWSAFASAAAVVALLPLVAGRLPSGPGPATAWKVGLAAAGGLVAFWVLIALPLVASNRGFLLTAGVALGAGALWLAPGRQAARTTGTRAEDRRPGSAA